MGDLRIARVVFSSKQRAADVGKKLAVEEFKKLLRPYLKDEAAVNFLADILESMYDLIEASIEAGGVPSKLEVMKVMGTRVKAVGSMFGGEQRLACVSSVVDLGLDLKKYHKLGHAGALGVAALAAFMVYDALTVYEECSLAYMDYQMEQRIRAFEAHLEAARRQRHQFKVSSLDEAFRISSVQLSCTMAKTAAGF